MKKTMEVNYPGYHGVPAKAMVNVYQLAGGSGGKPTRVLVLSHPTGDYVGLSITNGFERVATQLWNDGQLNHTTFGRLIWIEHYPASTRGGEESFNLVTLEWTNEGARHPNWHYVDRGWVEMLIKQKFVL